MASKNGTTKKNGPVNRVKTLFAGTDGNAAKGMHVPFNVMPLAVYGAWRQGDWGAVAEKDGYFIYREGKVIFVYHGGGTGVGKEAKHEYTLGSLPAGWEAAEIYHDTTDAKGWFVGLATAMAKLKSLQDARGGADDAMGEILHFHADNGDDE